MMCLLCSLGPSKQRAHRPCRRVRLEMFAAVRWCFRLLIVAIPACGAVGRQRSMPGRNHPLYQSARRRRARWAWASLPLDSSRRGVRNRRRGVVCAGSSTRDDGNCIYPANDGGSERTDLLAGGPLLVVVVDEASV